LDKELKLLSSITTWHTSVIQHWSNYLLSKMWAFRVRITLSFSIRMLM